MGVNRWWGARIASLSFPRSCLSLAPLPFFALPIPRLPVRSALALPMDMSYESATTWCIPLAVVQAPHTHSRTHTRGQREGRL